METQHGYALFGIGASCLGFLRSAPLSDPDARACARDVLSIYDGADDASLQSRAAELLKATPLLLLNYT